MSRFNKPGLVGALDVERDLTSTEIRYYGPSKEDDSVTVDITGKLAVDTLLGVQEETWKATVLPADSKAHDEYLDQVIAKQSGVQWPKFDFDRATLPVELPVPDFLKLPEGGFKRGEMVTFAALNPGYLSERKTDLSLHMMLRQAQNHPGTVLRVCLEHDADYARKLFEQAPDYSLDPAMAIGTPPLYEPKYPESDFFGKTLIEVDSVYPREMVELNTAAPKKHKTKKGGGKKKVKVSPLLKSLMKRV